jgi:ribonuclease HI
MYFNDSFTLNGAEGGIVLIPPKGDRLLYMIRLYFHATNNVVEYEALVNSLRITAELGVQRLYIRGDSEVIINQVMGELNCRDSRMAAYRQEVRMLDEKFNGFKLHHILWCDIEAADALARLRSCRDQPPLDMFMLDLIMLSIQLNEDSSTLASGTQSGEGGLAPTSEINPEIPIGLAGEAQELGSEIAIVIGSPDSNADWRKLISEYIWLRVIPDDEIET